MSFGPTPLDGSSTPIPMSSVVTSGTATPSALQGGPIITDSNNNKLAPAAMYMPDGNDLAEGATTDVAVTGDTAGSLSAKLRGLVKILTDIWDSVNHRIKVDGSGVTQPVDGTGTSILSFPAPPGPFPVDLINRDVSGYKELAFQFHGGDNNFVTFSASLNGTDYSNLTCNRVSYLIAQINTTYAEQTAASDISIWSVPITFRYLKLSYPSGVTAPSVTLWLSKESGVLRIINTISLIGTSPYLIGYIRNYGTQRIDQAAGQATDRNLLLSNGILGTVSITAVGTVALTIYDTSTIPVPANAVPIFALPANQPLGPVEAFGIQFFNGLSIKGNAGNPGFSLMWDLPHN